jgi:hypothetical protein
MDNYGNKMNTQPGAGPTAASGCWIDPRRCSRVRALRLPGLQASMRLRAVRSGMVCGRQDGHRLLPLDDSAAR